MEDKKVFFLFFFHGLEAHDCDRGSRVHWLCAKWGNFPFTICAACIFNLERLSNTNTRCPIIILGQPLQIVPNKLNDFLVFIFNWKWLFLWYKCNYMLFLLMSLHNLYLLLKRLPLHWIQFDETNFSAQPRQSRLHWMIFCRNV